jgi:hypothetical protein
MTLEQLRTQALFHFMAAEGDLIRREKEIKKEMTKRRIRLLLAFFRFEKSTRRALGVSEWPVFDIPDVQFQPDEEHNENDTAPPGW